MGYDIEIHNTAIVHHTAKIGAGAKIGPYSIVEENVEIGESSVVASNCLLSKGTKIGKECRVFHGATVGGIPQDLKFKGEESFCEIGDRTIIREFVTVNRGTEEGSATIVGNGCLLMAYSHVAHDCIIEEGAILANSVNLAGHVTVEKYAIVGGITPVHQFVRIGRYSIVGGASRAAQDVVPYVKAAGNPMAIYGLNIVGLTRRGFSQETVELLKKAYRIIFRSNLNTTQALERLKCDLPQTEEICYIIKFIETSKRGIAK